MSTKHDADIARPATPVTPSYGFVIDNTRCIGCHACSTACKSENEVPLGVYRTWVKTTETGQFPDTRRHFQVTRCNHCSNPPCVRICPTQAMVQRPDGIVEFDKDACIGCKACMQACPYDAIYIDPESGTAAKCHYCSHRTDIGLEPACVVVCPEHAIISGDLNDPSSEIARIVAKKKVTVRKPEQGTAPKLFYVGGDEVNLTPTATPRTPATHAAVDVISLHDGRVHVGPRPSELSRLPAPVPGHTYDRVLPSQPQGLPAAGPVQIGGTRAEHMVQVGYNAQHRVPWHWPVPAYLVTKSIGAGVLGLLSTAWLLGAPFASGTAISALVLALVMLAATTALLVFDLEKPERFLMILTRPNWSSWLTRGAVFLIGSTTLAGAWLGLEVGAVLGLLSEGFAAAARVPLMALTAPLSVGTAIYTAFLFGQAEGRDLWQSPLLPGHLFVQAATMGGAALLLGAPLGLVPTELLPLARWAFGAGLVADAFLTLTGELGMAHASESAARAAAEITRGRYKRWFWIGGMAIGHALPLALLATGSAGLGAVAALAAIAGLYCYEHAFVMAPQEVPNA